MSRDILLSDEDVHALGSGEAIVRDDVLGADTAHALARELAGHDSALQPAGMGRGAGHWVDTSERGDEIAWIEPDAARPGLRALLDLFERLQQELNQSAYLGLRRFDLQLARYRVPGARYARHRDAFRGKARRRVTAIYYVNPGWQPAHGGMLRLYTPAGPRDVAPQLDRLVLFLSERVEHEVLPSFALRTALTAWYYGSEHDPG